MVKLIKSIRAAKAAKRILRRMEAQPRKKRHKGSPPDAAEAEDAVARLARHEETKKRNSVAQLQPRDIKRKRAKGVVQGGLYEAHNKDATSFFAAIDSPFLRVCGSCGELTKSEQSVIRPFEPEADRFAPLLNNAGECEVVAEGVVTDPNWGLKMIWLCKRCDKSLRERVVPKFCRASGFRIAPVPSELAVLNCMEARLIGLGISFTTCVNLYCDGQEFTRGNSINYWNNAVDVVLDLPRPLSKCGIVYLNTLKAKSTTLFRVLPDFIRRALCWLIDHNPLYKNVRISEKNLAALREFNVESNLPTIILTDEESEALRPTENQLNADTTAPVGDNGQGSLQENGRSKSPTSTDASISEQSEQLSLTRRTSDNEMRGTYDTAFYSNLSSILQQREDVCAPVNAESIDDQCDQLNDLVETLELERNEQSSQSELEKIIQASNLESTEYPVQELQRQTDPIDEYATKLLMQNCFPILFPNGEGGFNPLSISEGKNEFRVHEAKLAEYCANLMKWHDRRFVIHRNFKFFCLNLVQRRQIDGLVRRVSDVGGKSRGKEDADEASATKAADKDLASAMKIVEYLKPYF